MLEVSPLDAAESFDPYPPDCRMAFAFSSLPCPPSRQPSLRLAFLPRGGVAGLPRSTRTTTNDLAPACAPAALMSVCLLATNKQPGCIDRKSTRLNSSHRC